MTSIEPTPPITLSRNDFERLLSLVHGLKSGSAELLEEEIARATIVGEDELPGGIVAMNSTVRFVDRITGSETELTLVYPHEANIDDGKVSILAPVGIALIGLRVGQSIRWPMPNGRHRDLRVVSVASARAPSKTA